jgi:hypothetical protein
MRTSRPRSTLLLPTLALSLVPFATGCGAGIGGTGPVAPSKPAVVFPTRAELARVPAQAPRVDAFGTSDIVADTWTIEDPIPAAAPYDDASPVGSLARQLQSAHGSSVRLSVPLRCASREIARFFVKRRGLPDEGLRRFIVARCGGDAPLVAPAAWGIPAAPSISDADIVARGSADITRLVAKQLERGDHELGVAMVREAGMAAIVAVVAPKSVDLEPGSRAVDATRKMVLRGTARRDVASVFAFANRGDFGVSPCEENRRVEAPKFEVTCELAEGDAWAWVEVVGSRKGQVLQEPLADVIMVEREGAGVTYTARSLGAPAPVASGAEFTSALVDRLNGVRRTAKLTPLLLAAKQSAENARVAGTIFDASIEGDAATVDRAAIGLLAGWDVEGGTIRDGHFFLGAVAPTRDATAWLDAALERPIGRLALLDPVAKQIAVGPAIPGDAPALGAAVTTYALFESDDHTADERQFFRALTAARAARGVAPPERVGGIDEVRAELADVLRNGKEPMAALNDLLQVAVNRTGSNVNGYVLETTDPAHVEIPEALLRAGPLDVVVAVTHHRAPGAAWGQYVIFVLIVDSAKTTPVQTAAAQRRAQSTVE